MHTSSL